MIRQNLPIRLVAGSGRATQLLLHGAAGALRRGDVQDRLAHLAGEWPPMAIAASSPDAASAGR